MTIKTDFGKGRSRARATRAFGDVARRPLALLVAMGVLGAAASARANPRPLPFTYPYQTLDKGQSEVELYGDMTPLRVWRDPADLGRGRLWEPYYQLQTEFEYGLTDRWELGFYQVMTADPEDGGGNKMSFDGFKWRVRTRLADAGVLPVDIAFYLELETMHDEVALEEKIILERRVGRLRLMANLWVEQELERPFDDTPAGEEKELAFIVNPTAGAVYEINPIAHVGAEYWARGMLAPEGEEAIERRNSAVHHFVGPTVHLNFGPLWWTAGLYAHLNDMNKPQPGEAYGPFWFRTVLGVEL